MMRLGPKALGAIGQPKAGSLGLGLTPGKGGGYVGPQKIQNISIGEIPNRGTVPAGGRTRIDTRHAFPVRLPLGKLATRVKFVLAARYITTSGETTTASAFVNLAAIEKDGVTTPVTRASSRAFNVAGGSAAVETDWVDVNAQNGDTIWWRSQVDVGSNYASSGTPTSPNQCIAYAPATPGNDIDGTGALTTPSGGVAVEEFGPVLMIADVGGTLSLMGIGDSIPFGFGALIAASDFLSTGLLRLAAASLNRPYLSACLSTRRLSAYITSGTLINALAAYHTDVISEMATNDLVAGRTAAQVFADDQTLAANMKAAGVLRVWRTKVLPRLASTSDAVTSLGGQTPETMFGDGGERDQLNALYAGAVGTTFAGLIDISTPVEEPTDHTKWKLRPYSSTLVGAVAGNVTTITVASPVAYGERLVASPGLGAQSTGNSIVSTVGGGTTVTINTALGVAQTNGVAVKGSPAPDGTHPMPLVHADMAIPVVQALSPYKGPG